jgi:hypothetical protein
VLKLFQPFSVHAVTIFRVNEAEGRSSSIYRSTNRRKDGDVELGTIRWEGGVAQCLSLRAEVRVGVRTLGDIHHAPHPTSFPLQDPFIDPLPHSPCRWQLRCMLNLQSLNYISDTAYKNIRTHLPFTDMTNVTISGELYKSQGSFLYNVLHSPVTLYLRTQ